MTEDEINKQVSKEAGSMSSVSVGIELDKEALRGLRDSVKAINKESKEMARNFKDALAALKEMRKDYGLTQVNRTTEMSPWGTGGGGGAQQGAAGTVIVGGRAQATQNVTPAPNAVTAAVNGREVLGGIGRFAAGVSSAENYEGVAGKNAGGTGFRGLVQQGVNGFSSGGNFASMAGTLAKVGVQAIDERVERGRGYALAADKSTLQMQQITGMSQREVMTNLRMPLTDYKLGTNGINQLMSLQARTGINAGQQASSVEAMRTISGFSMGAEGATSIIENLADPETVNKMFMMTGMSMIGPGGKQRSAQSVIEGLAKRAGLDNKKLAESAIAPGSVTRSTLSAMGVAGDLQEQVIQYGQANVAFREKGGKGSYDPTKEADRKRMGIDNTFAMEAEETERKRGKRDEQFYRDQAGAYAALERQTQRVTDAMAKLENVLAPIISARTGSRVAQKLIGGVASIGMGFAMGGPLGAGAAALGALGSILGDPRPQEGIDDLFDPMIPGTTTTVPRSIPSTTIPGSPTTTIPTGSSPTLDQSWRSNLLSSLGVSNSMGYEEVLTAGRLDQHGNPHTGGAPIEGSPEHWNIPGFDTPENYNVMRGTGEPGTGLNGTLNAALRKLANRAFVESGITIKLASGRRSSDEQAVWWNARMMVVPPGSKELESGYYTDARDNKQYKLVKYDGKLWMKRPNNRDNPIAPPGSSLHELGLAADLDLTDPKTKAYVAQNLWRFGLSAGTADGEPGHVQLAWTKDMTVQQFLGETGLSYEDARTKSSSAGFKSGNRSFDNNFNASKIASFGGVNLNAFNRAYLNKIGANVTLNKLQILTALSNSEGGGGAYNPYNVVSNNNRTVMIDGVEVDRPETNHNINGDWPVQEFDSFDEGVRSSVWHHLQNREEFIAVLKEDNPSMERLLQYAPGGSKRLIRTAVKNFTTAVSDKNLKGISNSYGSHGLNVAVGLPESTDWSKVKGWGGDPVSGSSMQPMSIPSAPTLSSSGSSGIGGSYHEGSTVTISPVIHMNGTGGSGTVSEYDLKVMAKKIAKLIEQEANLNKLRSM